MAGLVGWAVRSVAYGRAVCGAEVGWWVCEMGSCYLGHLFPAHPQRTRMNGAPGGTDAAGGRGGLLGCCVVNGCAAELALLHGGVDRLLAVRAWEDLDGTQIKCACHG